MPAAVPVTSTADPEVLTMDDEQQRMWLVGEYEYDSYSPHAVFATEADARAYAEAIRADVDEMPIFGPGEMPAIVEAWSAAVTVVASGDNAPPVLQQHRFSVLGHVPEWAKQPCALTNCETNGHGLYIRFHGFDKDAVLEACTKRYEAGLDAMGARR